jgi:hypothetical protein
LNNAEGGDDVVWVRQQQLIPLLVCPTSTASMYVEVRSGLYYVNNTPYWFDAQTSADLSDYLPSRNYDLYLLISLDMAANELVYTAGDEFVTETDLELDDGMPTAAAICPWRRSGCHRIPAR